MASDDEEDADSAEDGSARLLDLAALVASQAAGVAGMSQAVSAP